MRFLLPVFFLVISLCAAHAQQQERKLLERLTKPDLNLTYDPAKGSPVTNRSARTRSASTKEFATSRFSAKEFSARSFYGSKDATLGRGDFATSAAQTKGRNEIPKATAVAPTREMAGITGARDANRTVETKANGASDRTFAGRGRSQDRFDIEKGVPQGMKPVGYTGNLDVMSIDDIRELLNKNK